MRKENSKYIVVGSTEVACSVDDEIITVDIRDVESTIVRYINDDVILVGDNGLNIDRLALLAFEHGIKLQVNRHITYDFSGSFEGGKANVHDLLKLLSLATENTLAKAATLLIFHKLKNRIPYSYDLKDVLLLLDIHASEQVCKQVIKEKFESLYQKHVDSIIKNIKPQPKDGVVQKHVNYSLDLSLFLQENDGLFVLNADMAAGKTLHGLLPVYKTCVAQNIRVMLITPTIALSKALALGFNESMHYSLHKNAKSLAGSTGLICCINSAVEKDYFCEFAASCDVILVDEWEECVNQLTEKMSDSKKLSYRAMLTQRLYSLLNKKKVVLADALFSDLSTKHIIESTGRKVTLLDNTCKTKQEKKLTLYSRNQHIDLAISQAHKTQCEVGFSDAGQKLSNKYFELADAIKNGLNGNMNLITADYLKSNAGQAFFADPLKIISDATFSLFSPAITSGTNFPFEQFTRINLFASETISPLKLVQSSGRFRNTKVIQASFNERNSKYHHQRSVVVSSELIETTTEDEYPFELEKIENNVWAERVIERIVQDKLLRQNYANNTLILLQALGIQVERCLEERHSSTQKNNKDYTDNLLPVLSDEEYQQLLPIFGMLNFSQREQIRIYEALAFYNVLNQPDKHQQVLEFDNNGLSQERIKILHNLRRSNEQRVYSSEDRIKQLVSQTVLNSLQLDKNSFSGVYGYEEINKLHDFFQKGTVSLSGKTIKLKSIRNRFFGIDNKQYKNMGAFSKRILENLFGLKQESANRDKSKSSGEYSYMVSPESIRQLECFYQQATAMNHNKKADNHLLDDAA